MVPGKPVDMGIDHFAAAEVKKGTQVFRWQVAGQTTRKARGIHESPDTSNPTDPTQDDAMLRIGIIGVGGLGILTPRHRRRYRESKQGVDDRFRK